MLDALLLLVLAISVLIIGIWCISSSAKRRGPGLSRRSRPSAPDSAIAAARAADWSYTPRKDSDKGPLPLGGPKRTKRKDREY